MNPKGGQASPVSIRNSQCPQENPEDWRIYTKPPTAKEPERENHGEGQEIADGQLMLEEGLAAMDITEDTTFGICQGQVQ